MSLEEEPLSAVSVTQALSSKSGFDMAITALHQAARDELTKVDLDLFFDMNIGTDVATTGQEPAVNFRNYQTYLTPNNSRFATYWNWAYQEMIMRANTIIAHAQSAENASIWNDEKERNQIVAEARFFRAYAYNLLANLYGGVPLVDTVYNAPKTDFIRADRNTIYQFAKTDLEFASQWLPELVDGNKEGRIVKAAADHLLTEVEISLGDFEASIAAASNVINSGHYQLMTERFGRHTNEPGDVYSDLFRTGNQSRSSGNLESIYVWQFEDQTPGGYGSGNRGNHNLRGWGPFLVMLKDPNGQNGMDVVDSIGRGVGWVRPTNYFLYDLWKEDWNSDIRNSTNNIRRVHYYNNPASSYFGKPVEQRFSLEDTMQNCYPTIRKIEGQLVYDWASNGGRAGQTVSDFMVFRLAATYLLRAEAYLRNGDSFSATQDINKIRERAGATLIDESIISLDFILDERARELIVEEPRRRTLMRMGKLVERTKKYNIRPSTVNTIQDYHELWPIPQSAIDANISAKLEQNPGY
ncbi:membrane protein [Parapedobacter pyrenivorans]|uniref:Membrane protein n=1 Tax=Parapedobacter pyrenivorans TaxID=1305674 RepID=A0A917MBH9_9SPHI|nr:RagB/SusD family nutrient uptake outer membrane protein [Parapedobacter pyrenivorans]GGG89788.1 membrane protein [Parapedobacter pyrenivorans]